MPYLTSSADSTEVVIGLPANLFFGTGIPATILIFNRAKGDNKDVLFIDASQGYESGTNQNRLRDKDIDKVVDMYRAFQTETPRTTDEGEVLEDKFAYRATIQEVEENEYNLNIPRYVDTFEEDEVVDIPATQQNITELKKELVSVEEQMDVYLKELGFWASH